MATKNKYTAIITKAEEGGYVGQLIEHREVLTQGETIEEVEKNLSDALREILKEKNEEYEKNIKMMKLKKVIRRKISV